METLKKWIKTTMLNHYIKTGEILTFQRIQNILISKGFSYYIAKDGKQKLRIRKKVKPLYQRIKKNLPKIKKRRSLGLEILTKTIEEKEFGLYKELYKTFEEYLTTQDKKFLKNLKQSVKKQG